MEHFSHFSFSLNNFFLLSFDISSANFLSSMHFLQNTGQATTRMESEYSLVIQY